MRKNKTSPIPKNFRTLEDAGEFWDTHDLADYWDQTEEAPMSFRVKRKSHFFAIEPALALGLYAAAKSKGVSPETVANLWLRDMLDKDRVLRKRGTNRQTAA
jgi:hypothetical protein